MRGCSAAAPCSRGQAAPRQGALPAHLQGGGRGRGARRDHASERAARSMGSEWGCRAVTRPRTALAATRCPAWAAETCSKRRQRLCRSTSLTPTAAAPATPPGARRGRGVVLAPRAHTHRARLQRRTLVDWIGGWNGTWRQTDRQWAFGWAGGAARSMTVSSNHGAAQRLGVGLACVFALRAMVLGAKRWCCVVCRDVRSQCGTSESLAFFVGNLGASRWDLTRALQLARVGGGGSGSLGGCGSD